MPRHFAKFDRVGDVEAWEQVYTLPQTLGEEESETALDRLSDMVAQLVVGTLADTLPEAESEILL